MSPPGIVVSRGDPCRAGTGRPAVSRVARQRGRSAESGFTLIELILIIVVLSIAAGGVLSVFTTGTRGGANPLLTTQALQLAQEKMEFIIGDRANPLRGYAWVTAAVNPYAAESPVAGFPAFNRSVTISCVTSTDLNTPTGAPPCASEYAKVSVSVTHPTLGSVVLDGLVTNSSVTTYYLAGS